MERLNLSLINKDYDSLEKEIFSKIPEWSDGQYTDFSTSDAGSILLRTFIKLIDMSNWYVDTRANEAFPDRAREKKNIRGALRTIGYKMHGNLGAEVEVEALYTLGTLDDSIMIPKFTILDAEIPYIVRDNVYIASQTSRVKFIAVQGEVVSLRYTVDDIDSKGRIYLDRDDLDENNFMMTIGTDSWKLVDNVFVRDDHDRFYHIDYDREDNMFIQFIPGFIRYINPTNGVIQIKALISLGSKGSIAPNGIKGFSDEVLNSAGVDIKGNFKLSHDSCYFLGSDKESAEHALIYSKKHFRLLDTLVSLPDYETFCELHKDVRKARAVDISVSEANIEQPYFVKVYVIGKNNTLVEGNVIQELTNNILTNKKYIRGTTFEILNGNHHTIIGDLKVYLRNTSTDSKIVRQKIIDKWYEFFESEERGFGEDFKFVNLSTYLSKAHEDILYIDSDNLRDITIEYNEIMVGGKIEGELGVERIKFYIR